MRALSGAGASGLLLGAMLLAACNSGASSPAASRDAPPQVDDSAPPPPEAPQVDTTDEPTPTPTPVEPVAPAPAPGKLPEPLTRAQIDAPIPSDPPKLDFYKKGDAACAPGQHLQGGLPPDAHEIRCVDEQGHWTGMEARFHRGDKPQLQRVGLLDDGRMVGVWLWFHPSGAKAAEHTYVDGQLHGTMRRFAESGQELEYGEYRAGRPWGLFVQHDENGKELGRAQLQSGTGVLVQASPSGRSESEYVEGLLHGTHRRFDGEGRLLEQSHWSGGELHGLETRWDLAGQRLSEGQWVRGQQQGTFVRWKDGAEIERSEWVDGEQRSRLLVRDGQPIAAAPPPTACDTDAGLSDMLQAARGRGLPDRHACVTRMPMFPGVVLLGDFAYDRGCMGAIWVLDCKLVDPAPRTAELLARAGWAKADGEQRVELAREYMREFGLAYAGSISSSPEPPQWSARLDGSVEGIVWVAAPAGMRRGQALDKVQLEFAIDGSLTRTQLEHRDTRE